MPHSAQIANRALDEIDAFDVGIVERFLVHMLANDADSHPVQGALIGEASIRLRRQPADAESGELILRVVAGDDLEHASGILDVAAQRPHARIQSRANHSITADQLLRRRESHNAVVLGGMMDRSPSFLADGARHQVCGDR